ncbi:MAG: NAD-dependent epimerase/dehydratase family protein [Oscillospiraceae bacterium]|nr:NAD-dependent epimerase/dehydratase family protein [Oscillospiraceae bacterium]
MKRAIITGATGAIGTALIEELLSNDIEVLVITRKSSKRNSVIPVDPRIMIKYADLSELNSLENDTGSQFDVFYHFAWAGASGAGRNDMYLQNDNVRYSLDAVKMAKRFGCHTFIGAGSQAEYGRTNAKLTPETPTFPEMGYGYAKLCAGMMTRELAEQEGVKHVWVRVLSVYGPHDGENSLISMIIRTLKKGESPKLTAGTQLWDYLYSRDAARAFVLLGDKGRDGKVYVLGSGEARPLKEYSEIIRKEIAPEISINYGAVPFSGKQIMYLCSDITEINDDVGWMPQYDFKTGIKEILAYV